ncbi:SpoIIE family protein phosphatase [Streptomyces sp. AC563]|uniref:ATP-binding SpoIIE family protein phosphatase n=1 Tax=Streptomyces buecherae TaxID=2763006 RepID=UPI00164E6ECD|nr:SpoIIE family protein phosphatase [Streptomyces buecherae]MBC3990300.1 SpoIIE family protein phosphatase [Streptomyces buecherae]
MRTEDVLATIRTGLWRWGNASAKVTLDAEAARLLGLPAVPVTLPEATARARFHPVDWTEINGIINLALTEGTLAEARLRVVDEQGTVLRTVRSRTRPIVRGEHFELVGTLEEVPALVPGTAAATPVTGDWRRNREAFLLDAGRALAEAQSSAEVLRVAAGLSMPGFTPDGLAVFGVEGNRITVIGHQGYGEEDEGPFFDMSVDSDFPAAEAVRTGRAVYLPTPEDYRRRFPAAWAIAQPLGRHSWAFLPLIVAGRTIGAWMGAFSQPVSFTPDERSVLTTIARMFAQALSRASLHDTERELADGLQRAMLPDRRPEVPGLTIAARYVPTGGGLQVGGDWYDVITLGAGRTALVIGDVMGRGLRAAAVMGQLRTAVRAYARLDLPPHEVLQLLDGLAAEIDASQIATCVYAVHDPNEGRLIYASAGHLPILVRDPDGTVHRAAEPTGPPLGTGGWLHASGSVPLSPGSSAVLYTDGLVERRDRDIDEGVADLERAFAGAAGSPQVMCDRLIRSLGITADHDDDVAVLVLQHPARTGHDAELFHNAALELLGGVEAAPRARAFASGVLASWRFPTELRDLGVLATSELVANSLQHGTPPMRLRLRRTDRRLIIEVTDGDDHLPRRRRAEPADEAGRGISIIATIASSWGSRRTPDGGKAVWCEFALPRH